MPPLHSLLGLLRGEPVAEAHAFGSDALHARDPVRQLRRQQPVVGGSTASFLTAVIRTFTETAPNPRASITSVTATVYERLRNSMLVTLKAVTAFRIHCSPAKTLAA